MIKRFKLTGYKAFNEFRGSLGKRAYLVGANNAGKSTIIEALRGAARMVARAKLYGPEVSRRDQGRSVAAHRLNAARLGVVEENLRHEFREEREARLEVVFDSGGILSAVWPPAGADNEAPYFYVGLPDGPSVPEPRHVKANFPTIGLVPLLTPLEPNERYVSRDTLRSKADTYLASRHFRNHMYDLKRRGEFGSFRDFVQTWTPEIEVLDLDADPVAGQLDVFYSETGQRTPREISWAGDGLQIWLQLLFHLYRLRDAGVIIFDEPDVYLHADLQRRLVRVVEGLDAQTLMATHSSEVLTEASSDALVWVDKAAKGTVRGRQIDLDRLSAVLGSHFNLRLAKALRSRVVVFVEGQDMRILRHLAKTVGATALAQEVEVAVIPLEGYANWDRLEPFNWLTQKLLKGVVATYVILDRDYREEADVKSVIARLSAMGIRAHVWKRKELESYLLEPAAIARLTKVEAPRIDIWLADAADQLRGEAQAAWVTQYITRARGKRRPQKDLRVEAELRFTRLWDDAPSRLWRVNAKHVLARLNDRLAEGKHPTVSAVALARELRTAEIAPEVADLLTAIEEAIASA